MKILESRWGVLISYLIVIYLMIIFISNNFVITNDLILKLYSGILGKEQINKILITKSTFSWLIYSISILIIILKIFSTAVVLYTGLIFTSYRQVKFADLVKIATISEFIFVLYALLKLAYIYFKDISTLYELNTNYPLSLFSLVVSDTLDIWMIYPLSVINVAEIVYWFILAFFLSKSFNIKYIKGFTFVVNTYVLSLIVWVSFVVFLTLLQS